MRFSSRFRNLSLGLATASFICAGAALAQTSDAAQQPSQSWNQSGQSQAWQLVGVNARLDHTLDSKSAHPGEKIMARLDGTVKTASGMKLERGTQLMGTVTSVQPASNGGASSLAIAFTTAQMKDGKQIPVKVTVLGAFPSNETNQAEYGQETMPPAPRHVSSQEKIDQESGLLNHISLHSRVQGQNSGTFRKKDGDLKLTAGTFLQIGIAPMNSNMTSNGV